jgi:acyl-CoA thioesterase FadM
MTSEVAHLLRTGLRPVTIGDTDASGLVYYPSIFRWATEEYETWLRESGFPLAEILDDNRATPAVRVEATLHASFGLGTELATSLSSLTIGRSSFTVRFECRDSHHERLLAVHTTHVFVAIDRPGVGPPKLRAHPLPDTLRNLLASNA